MVKIKTLFLTALGICLLTACSAMVIRNARSEENLRQRVNEYYASRLEGNLAKAFEYENMSLDGKVTKSEYNPGRMIKSVSVKEIVIDQDVAWVTLDAVYNIPQMSGFPNFKNDLKNDIKDKWVFKNNNWYHIKQAFMGGKEW